VRRLRTFVALELSPESLEAAIGVLGTLRGSEAARSVEVSWSRPEGLHLTLAFLGSIEPERLPEIEASLGSVAAAQRLFTLRLAGAGTFPRGGRPQILWLGIRGALPDLGALRIAIAEALGRLGFAAPTEAFNPHVTLLRLKRPSGGSALASALKRIPLPEVPGWEAREMVLFESRLGPRGSTYHPLARFPFSRG
jgi:2'-5' RNA ligase